MHSYRGSTNASAPGKRGKIGGRNDDEEWNGQEWEIRPDEGPAVRGNMRLNTPARRCLAP